jgi:hypothetical protein
LLRINLTARLARLGLCRRFFVEAILTLHRAKDTYSADYLSRERYVGTRFDFVCVNTERNRLNAPGISGRAARYNNTPQPHFRCRRQPRVLRQRARASCARAPRHRCGCRRALQRHHFLSAAVATRPGERLALALALRRPFSGGRTRLAPHQRLARTLRHRRRRRLAGKPPPPPPCHPPRQSAPLGLSKSGYRRCCSALATRKPSRLSRRATSSCRLTRPCFPPLRATPQPHRRRRQPGAERRRSRAKTARAARALCATTAQAGVASPSGHLCTWPRGKGGARGQGRRGGMGRARRRSPTGRSCRGRSRRPTSGSSGRAAAARGELRRRRRPMGRPMGRRSQAQLPREGRGRTSLLGRPKGGRGRKEVRGRRGQQPSPGGSAAKSRRRRCQGLGGQRLRGQGLEGQGRPGQGGGAPGTVSAAVSPLLLARRPPQPPRRPPPLLRRLAVFWGEGR